MLLLVWGLPAVVVVASFVTLGIAIRAGDLDASSDAVRRMAQVQQTDLGADQAALRRGLGASLSVDETGVRLQLLGAGEDETSLQLRFEHPADATLDQDIMLSRQGEVWDGALQLPAADHWRLILHAADRSWRLEGELRGSRGVAVLTPRFGQD